MDVVAVKRSLEMDGTLTLPDDFFDMFVLHGVNVDAVDSSRVLCSFTVPPRFSSSPKSGGYLHGGVIASLADIVGSAVLIAAGIPTSGVSLEISVSFVDRALIGEEVEIEGKLLRVGKSVGVTSIDFRKKKDGKVVAQARHTKYLAVSSRL